MDSQAVVWALFSPGELSTRVRALLSDANTQIVVSPVTIYELTYKFLAGRLPDVAPLVADYPAILRRLGAHELPITYEHAHRAAVLPRTHRDPFDRLIAAQSIVEGIAVVTIDRGIGELGATTIW